MFLADNAVIRILAGKGRPDEGLDIAVGFRDHVLVAFALDRQRVQSAEIVQAEFACALRQRRCEFHPGFVVGGHGTHFMFVGKSRW